MLSYPIFVNDLGLAWDYSFNKLTVISKFKKW